jgi:hypothetical protein
MISSLAQASLVAPSLHFQLPLFSIYPHHVFSIDLGFPSHDFSTKKRSYKFQILTF